MPVGGRDVPVGGRPTTRQADPTLFSGATGFAPKVVAPVLKGSVAFLAPSKGFPPKNSQGTSSPNLKNSENQV